MGTTFTEKNWNQLRLLVMKDVLSFVETISSMVLKFPKNIALKSQLNIYEMQFN